MRFPSPPRSHFVTRCVFVLTVLCFCFPLSVLAQTLNITTNPPGATVELNGVPSGTTPFEQKFSALRVHATLQPLDSH